MAVHEGCPQQGLELRMGAFIFVSSLAMLMASFSWHCDFVRRPYDVALRVVWRAMRLFFPRHRNRFVIRHEATPAHPAPSAWHVGVPVLKMCNRGPR